MRNMRRTASWKWIAAAAIMMAAPVMDGHAFYGETHQNTAEDAVLYMELHGSNQQRWAADYLKAKSGGRVTGGAGFDPNNGDGTQYGFVNVARAGATAPDYSQDVWWDDFTTWGWNSFGINFTSWTHFINLLKTNNDGKTIKNDNYNDFDGYAYNGSYGFPSVGIDYTVASWMNNAKMTIDLPGCTSCSDKFSFVPGGNPAVDYRQNGSAIPLGNPGGSKRLGADDGTNYNCFSDSSMNDCPDRGLKIGGLYQIPNVYPGTSAYFSGDEDWAIFEPMDNAATFYYNEWFLEGGASRNSQLDPASVAGRYYSLGSADVAYLALVMHYAGDAAVMQHVWNTSGFNHTDYESWINDRYGARVTGGGDPNKNFENFATVTAMIRSRSNRETGALDHIITEGSFLTYLLGHRSAYDVLSNTDATTRGNAAREAVNGAIASIVILYEKGVMDLRRYR